MHESDTIVALATAAGPAAIATVRLSGSDSITIAARLFSPASLSEIPSHRAVFGQIHDPETGRLLDHALCTVMRGPGSYTGEDVVEISCHGSPAVTNEVLALCCRQGARIALPGEFTRRALEHGRMDLAQAEAVLDLIHARTPLAARAAAEKLSGGFSNEIECIAEHLLSLLAKVEAGLDFPEDVENAESETFCSALERQAAEPLARILSAYNDGEVLRSGVYVAIVGRPNAGKSSLLNALLDRDRVLVTEEAGTTRDVVEESLITSGGLFVLADTAGLSENAARLELLSMERSRQALEKARLVLFVVDGSRGSVEEEAQLLEAECTGKEVLVLANKADIAGEEKLACVEAAFSGRNVLRISALTGQNLSLLRRHMAAFFPTFSGSASCGPNMRQKLSLERAAAGIQAALDNARSQAWELAAEDLRISIAGLDETLGRNVSEDVLDRIFSLFCIGK
ncbi:MAG: tRNA uridine-5-carboxymethylaminomethyl(34) synthesis GTPase MnmE [Thermodesulfobacteriota bacterium]